MNPADRGHLFVIAAASGTGKTSLVRALMAADPGLEFSVSYTTRARRPNERDGHDYHFVTRGRFAAMVEAGDFLEHAEVFDNRYGTARTDVEQALAAGRRLILEIDWQGARQIRRQLPESVQIFILPPSRGTLEQRLRQRSNDTPEVIARRLEDSVAELSHWHEFEYVVINDDFERALADLQTIVAGRGAALRASRPGLAGFAAGLMA